MRRLIAALAGSALFLAASAAQAAPSDAAALSTKPAFAKAALAKTAIGLPASLHAASPADGKLAVVAIAMDDELRDAAGDLGLSLESAAGSVDIAAREEALLQQAAKTGALVIAPSVREEAGHVVVRIAVANRDGAINVRVAETSAADAPVRAAVLMRDLVATLRGAPANAGKTVMPVNAPSPPAPVEPWSSGRATLVVNATLFGGVLGFSVQRASGSNDPRLLFPLLAVGAGIGLGASILATEEWQFTPADAWFLASGMWWPTLAGHLIYAGHFANAFPDGDQWEFGLTFGTGGLVMASLSLALHPASDGGAWLAHSGGAAGLAFGGLIQLAAHGDVHETPLAGMGYGAAIGWLGAASAATLVRVDARHVLAFDAGTIVGGLGGAALASPLVFGNSSEGRQRAWIGITAGAALAGGVTGVLFTGKAANKSSPLPSSSWLVPQITPLGESNVAARRAPIVGLAWSGSLDASCRPSRLGP